MKRVVAAVLLSVLTVLGVRSVSSAPATPECCKHEHRAVHGDLVAGNWYDGYCTLCGKFGHRSSFHGHRGGGCGVRG